MVFLTFGFVSAQSQVATNLLLRQSLAKSQKSSFRTATSFLSTLYPDKTTTDEHKWTQILTRIFHSYLPFLINTGLQPGAWTLAKVQGGVAETSSDLRAPHQFY
jgi:hypothetical protein